MMMTGIWTFSSSAAGAVSLAVGAAGVAAAAGAWGVALLHLLARAQGYHCPSGGHEVWPLIDRQ